MLAGFTNLCCRVKEDVASIEEAESQLLPWASHPRHLCKHGLHVCVWSQINTQTNDY